jgi:type VII secretion-associated protein (TIGR03931 family)
LADGHTTVLEVARELVVVAPAAGRATVIPSCDDGTEMDVVVSAVGRTPAVLVDAPEEARLFATAVADRLRASGIAVSFVRDDAVRDAVAESRGGVTESVVREDFELPRRRRSAALVAGITAVVVLGGLAMRPGASGAPDDIAMSLLTEGRVGVMVPAVWTVRRVTSGPGSARVQIVSPSDADVALHLTQTAGVPSNLAVTADSIHTALETEAAGVFVDFTAAGERAGRRVVTYRELRPDRHVEWVVFVDDTVRIAIGCQTAPGREQLIRPICDRAVESAHTVF